MGVDARDGVVGRADADDGGARSTRDIRATRVDAWDERARVGGRERCERCDGGVGCVRARASAREGDGGVEDGGGWWGIFEKGPLGSV